MRQKLRVYTGSPGPYFDRKGSPMKSLKWMLVFGVVLIAAQVGAGEAPVLKTMKDKLSYATGVDMVRSFQRQGVEVDKDLFLKGVKDGLSGGTLLMSDHEINQMLKVFMAEQKMKQAEWKLQQSELKRKERENATKTGPGSPVPIATDNTRP